MRPSIKQQIETIVARATRRKWPSVTIMVRTDGKVLYGERQDIAEELFAADVNQDMAWMRTIDLA